MIVVGFSFLVERSPSILLVIRYLVPAIFVSVSPPTSTRGFPLTLLPFVMRSLRSTSVVQFE